MRDTRLSHWLTMASGAVLTAVLTLTLPGCSSKTTGDNLTIGFLYVGPKDDYGYSQAHAEGAAAVKKMEGVKVLEVEKVDETDASQQTMKNMIDNKGATAIFATSYNYFDPHVLEVAKLYPKVTFFHCGGTFDKQKHPENVHTYFGYIDECQYLSGIIAGYATKSNKLGFIAAIPIPQVRRNINAFLLGARSVNPKAEVHVIFTGGWLKPKEEADATKVLLGKGCDVFTCHVDSPKTVFEIAAEGGAYICGYHASQADLIKDKYLTGAEWNWEKVYVDYVNQLKKGEKIANSMRGGLKEGVVKTSPYGPAVKPEWKKTADEVKAKLKDGSFLIFKGPIKDDQGAIVIAEGVKYVDTDPKLEEMNYFVEGVSAAK